MNSQQELEKMLGAPRFETYFIVANGDLKRAVEIYRWNTHLAGAFHTQLSYFEVLTRNAIDKALREWNYKECGSQNWTLEHQSADLLYTMFKKPLHQARKWALRESKRRPSQHPRKNAPYNHDDVVAQLTLGNWSSLLGEALPAHKKNGQELWRLCLHHAFPNISDDDSSREALGQKLERLTRLRNRVSHQENLLKINPESRLNDILSVLSAIDTKYPAWVMAESQIRRICKSDPRRS